MHAKGHLDITRVTLVDEPWTWEDFALCGELSDLIREKAPGLKIMTTKWPQKELYGKTDIWSLGFFQEKEMAAARERGEILEWYPNWHFIIDRPLNDTRMLGFTMLKYGISGIFLWHTICGWEKKGNIRYVPRWVYSDGRSIWGCGLLIDPSDDFTQIESSLRMETLRDALEDYEYIQLLKDAADRTGDAATIAKVNTLIKDTIDSIVFDYKAYETEERWDRIQWEADWKKMRDARDRLGEAIEQLKQQE